MAEIRLENELRAVLRLLAARTAGELVSDRRTGELAGVEVKLTATPTQHYARTLAGFAERFGSRFTVGLVVHAGRHTLPLGERLWAVPVSALWRSDSPAA